MNHEHASADLCTGNINMESVDGHYIITDTTPADTDDTTTGRPQ